MSEKWLHVSYLIEMPQRLNEAYWVGNPREPRLVQCSFSSFPALPLSPVISSDLLPGHSKTIWKRRRALQQLASPLSSPWLISILLRDQPIHKRGRRGVGQASWRDKTSPRSAFTTTAGRHNGGNHSWALPSVALVQPRQANNAMHCNSLSFVNAQEAQWDCNRLTRTVLANMNNK